MPEYDVTVVKTVTYVQQIADALAEEKEGK